MSEQEAWRIVRAIRDMVGAHSEYIHGIRDGRRGDALQELADACVSTEVELVQLLTATPACGHVFGDGEKCPMPKGHGATVPVNADPATPQGGAES